MRWEKGKKSLNMKSFNQHESMTTHGESVAFMKNTYKHDNLRSCIKGKLSE